MYLGLTYRTSSSFFLSHVQSQENQSQIMTHTIHQTNSSYRDSTVTTKPTTLINCRRPLNLKSITLKEHIISFGLMIAT